MCKIPIATLLRWTQGYGEEHRFSTGLWLTHREVWGFESLMSQRPVLVLSFLHNVQFTVGLHTPHFNGREEENTYKNKTEEFVE